MRVLVTGATGFLGSHLCRRLCESGSRVTAFHRASSNVSALVSAGVDFRAGDLTNFDRLCEVVRGHDAVIHAAAEIRYSSRFANAHQQVNIEGTRNVVRACRQECVSRLVHVSSVSAIGIPEPTDGPADETFPFNLERSRLTYHLSKKRAEEAVLEETGKGLDAVIVNPASIFGPFGRIYRGAEMIRKVASSRIVSYYRGGICCVHVDDVSSGILTALQRGARGERYILGGENVTFEEIARRSASAQDLARWMVPVPPIVTGLLSAVLTPAGHLLRRSFRFTPELHYCASRPMFYKSDKAVRELDYRFRPFRDIIAEVLATRQG